MITYFFIINQAIAQETYNSGATHCSLYSRIYILVFSCITDPLSYFPRFLFFSPAILVLYCAISIKTHPILTWTDLQQYNLCHF